MKIAGINKDISIVGRGSHLEIWDTQKFEEYIGSNEDFDKVYYETFGAGLVSTE
jgi:DNA-binding transcriptional regulator/RsmH inhibitor MraZ